MNSINYVFFVICLSMAGFLTYKGLTDKVLQGDRAFAIFFIMAVSGWLCAYLMYRQIIRVRNSPQLAIKMTDEMPAFQGMKIWQIAIVLALSAIVITYSYNS